MANYILNRITTDFDAQRAGDFATAQNLLAWLSGRRADLMGERDALLSGEAAHALHWLFLATAGTFYRNTQNDTAIFPSRFGSLAESLSSVSEARYDWQTGEEYIRPMSMKTCPPNYFMNGFRFHLRPHPTDEERQVVAGILALSCVRSSRPYQDQNIRERLTVPLYTEEQSMLFQLGDRSFSTGQQIGWSQNPYLPDCDDTSSSSPCETTLQCELPGDVATGFAYIRDGSGMLTNIAIRCHRGP